MCPKPLPKITKKITVAKVQKSFETSNCRTLQITLKIIVIIITLPGYTATHT